MTTGPVWEAGEKTHRDENFPVASHLVSKQHRPVILAFYRFRAGRRRCRRPSAAFGKREDPQVGSV